MLSADEQISSFFGGALPSVRADLGVRQASSSPQQETRKSKWQKPSGKGPDWTDNQGQASGYQQWQKKDEDVKELTNIMGRLLLRLEDEASFRRAEGSWIMFHETQSKSSILANLFECAKIWKDQQKDEKTKLTLGLRHTLLLCLLTELESRASRVTQNQELMEVMRKDGWYVGGDRPGWVYTRWDPNTKKEVPQEGVEPLDQASLLNSLKILKQRVTVEGALHRFHATRALSETYSTESVAFLLTTCHRNPDTTVAEQLYIHFNRLCNCSATRLVGMRMRPERAQRQPLAKVLTERLSLRDQKQWRNS